jgi:hypothetical protein
MVVKADSIRDSARPLRVLVLRRTPNCVLRRAAARSRVAALPGT